jgi:hypothetical protein
MIASQRRNLHGIENDDQQIEPSLIWAPDSVPENLLLAEISIKFKNQNFCVI